MILGYKKVFMNNWCHLFLIIVSMLLNDYAMVDSMKTNPLGCYHTSALQIIFMIP